MGPTRYTCYTDDNNNLPCDMVGYEPKNTLEGNYE